MATLGRYSLLNVLGSGGMCDVWRAHDPDGHVVAVKVLHSGLDTGLLQREIQTTARLNHPGIVQIYRWGAATDDEAISLGLPGGTPWIAMAIAEGGSLDTNSISSWTGLRHLAVALLDALMHAHARSVIHRDIKPGNILVSGGSQDAQYVLSDFGIAFPKSQVRDGQMPLAAAGTLLYMSPEQLRGRWRDFGPYTDLFSLGVLLYEVAFGRLPFHGETGVAIAMAHAEGPDLSLRARFAVPDRFAGWLGKLLAFAMAADAAYGLLELAPPPPESEPSLRPLLAEAKTLTMPLQWTTELSKARAVPRELRATLHLAGASPLVRDWRASARDHPPIGLELHGLRRASMVGREPLRDELWSRLIAMIESGTSSAVVLSGPSGAGATRSARWLCERAAEVGVAEHVILRANHRGATLGETIQHYFGLAGLDEPSRIERLRELFDEDADVELISDISRGILVSVPDQIVAIEQALQFVSRGRPIVAWIDDADQQVDPLEVATALVGQPLPVLFVLTTMREVAEDKHPYEAERIRDLLGMERTCELRVAAMSSEEIGAFVDAVLATTDETRDQIIEAAGGMPLRALQVMELAVIGAADGIDATTSMESIWLRRCERTLPAEDREPMLAAAILGQHVQIERWRRLCDLAGVTVPTDFELRLLAGRFWAVEDGELQFEHRSLRDAVIADADPDELRRLHALAAEVDARTEEWAADRGRHIVQAGFVEEGARVLFEASHTLLYEYRIAQTKSLAQWLKHALRGGPARSPAWLWLELIEASIALREWRSVEALALAVDIAARAEASQQWDAAADAMRIQGIAQRNIDPASDLVPLTERARAMAERSQNSNTVGRVLERLGLCYKEEGRNHEAVTALSRATEASDPRVAVRACVHLAEALMAMGRFDDARVALMRGQALARSASLRMTQCDVLNTLGELERVRGNFDAADAHLARAQRMLSRAYMTDVVVLMVNRAAIQLSRVDPDRAIQMIDEGLPLLVDPDPYVLDHCEVLYAVAAAQKGDVDAWRARVNEASTALHGMEYAQLWVLAADGWQKDGVLQDEALRLALAALPKEASEMREELETRVRDG